MTAPRFDLTAPVERDLEDIFFEVIERHGRLVAERVYDNLLRTFELLAAMPEMGRHRPEYGQLRIASGRRAGPAYIAYRSDVRPIRPKLSTRESDLLRHITVGVEHAALTEVATRIADRSHREEVLRVDADRERVGEGREAAEAQG